MILVHVKQSVPGVVGVGATGFGALVERLTQESLPLLHGLSALGTALAGFATALYYFAKWRQHNAGND